MNRKQYREIVLKSKCILTERNRIHFLINMNSFGMLEMKVTEKKNKALDYETTLFVRRKYHLDVAEHNRHISNWGFITAIDKYTNTWTSQFPGSQCLPF